MEMWLIYQILCVFVPCILYEIYWIRKSGKFSKKHLVWIFIFVLYLYLCIDVAGIGSVWYIGRNETLIRMDEINFIPFSSDGVLTYLLNILMFMPLGFLLPLIWKSNRQVSKVFGTSVVFSLLIEFFQLFNLRVTDVDDLMMNTLGGMIGFVIRKIGENLWKNKKDESKEGWLPKNETIWLIALATFGKFFLYNGRLFG